MPARAADTVAAVPESGFIRLNFNFAPAAHITATAQGGVLTLAFDRKVTLAPQAIIALSGGAIASGRADADGKTLRFALTQPVRLHQSALGDHAVVDLAPQNFTGAMPDLVTPPKPPPKPLGHGKPAGNQAAHRDLCAIYKAGFRLAAGLLPYTVFPGAGKLTVRFQALARPDLSAITRFAPPWVKNAAWRMDGNTTVVEFETDSDSGVHDFRDGSKIVLDILAPKADTTASAAQAAPASSRQARSSPRVSTAQAKAIADTANQLAAKDNSAARRRNPKPSRRIQSPKPRRRPSPPTSKPRARRRNPSRLNPCRVPTAVSSRTARSSHSRVRARIQAPSSFEA